MMGRREYPVIKGCRTGKDAYRTYDVAAAIMNAHEEIETVYLGTCCGHYHVTKSTPGEYSQLVAKHTAQTLRPRVDVALACARIAGAPKRQGPR